MNLSINPMKLLEIKIPEITRFLVRKIIITRVFYSKVSLSISWNVFETIFLFRQNSSPF